MHFREMIRQSLQQRGKGLPLLSAQAVKQFFNPLLVPGRRRSKKLARGVGQTNSASAMILQIFAAGDKAGPDHPVDRDTQARRLDEQVAAEFVHPRTADAAGLQASQ